MIWYLIFMVLGFFLGVEIAIAKGRSGALWGLLCFLFPFLVLILIVQPKTEKRQVDEEQKKTKIGIKRGDLKSCPDCAEAVLQAAKVCKHCGYRWIVKGETDCPSGEPPLTTEP